MVAIAREEPIEDEREGAERGDPLRRTIHVALAIYLTPVVMIVCAIGGVSILFDKLNQATGRHAKPAGRSVNPGHFSVARSSRIGVRLPVTHDHRRTRVGR